MSSFLPRFDGLACEALGVCSSSSASLHGTGGQECVIREADAFYTHARSLAAVIRVLLVFVAGQLLLSIVLGLLVFGKGL